MHLRLIVTSISKYKINPIVKFLIISDFIYYSAYQFFTPIFAVFIVDDIGASLEVVGISASIYLVVKSLIEMPVGYLIDKTKSEKDDLLTAFLGTIIVAITYFAFAFITEIWHLYILQGLLGVGVGIAYPGWSAMFSRHIDKGREGMEWSIYDVVIGMGMALSAGIGAFLATKYGFSVVFIVVSIVTFISALFLLFVRNKIQR